MREDGEVLAVAWLVQLLETLGPDERAVVVLREAFERSYEESAEIVGKSATACRHLFSRAVKRLRREHARPAATVPESVVQQFIEALASEDEQRLLGLLAEDTILFSDGEGRVRAAVNPIYGPGKIARFFFGIRRKNGLSIRCVSSARMANQHWSEQPPAMLPCWHFPLTASGLPPCI